jgi:hypothetical protein
MYKNSVSTSQETYDVSATESNRLVLYGERVIVYCKNRTEHTDTLWAQSSQYLTGNTLLLRYRAQPVNSDLREE